MTGYLHIKSALVLGIVFAFLANIIGPMPSAQAHEFVLPQLGIMVQLSPAFTPPTLKGIKVHPDNPFRFDFLLDKGDFTLANEAIKKESSKLIKYFLASLTVPEKDLWVNLSPYEKDRIVPRSFGQTEMGRDLLAQDYLLKQITASLIYPEDEFGKKFWKRIYEESAKKFGTTNIPVNTFNKVWIVPEKAVVYENAQAGTAYIVESKLKVMLEQDYLSLEKHHPVNSEKDVNDLGSQIVREIVIPALIKEVNENKNFAQLRQVYNSLILAIWYKKKIKESVLSQVYADRNKIAGINIDDPQEKQKIYKQYLKAFKKGVYNYIKEEVDPITQEIIPRKYFSGGLDLAMNATNLGAAELQIVNSIDAALLANHPQQVSVNIIPSEESNPGDAQYGDLAMTSLIEDFQQSSQLSKERLEEIERELKEAMQLGNQHVDVLVGFTPTMSDKDKQDILREAFINMHPDRFTDNAKGEVAGRIASLLGQIKSDLKDEKDGLFIKDDGSFFGQPDKMDLYRLTVLRQIKQDFWEKLEGRDHHLRISHVHPQQYDVFLYPEKHIQWKGQYVNGIRIMVGRGTLGIIKINEPMEIEGIDFNYDFFPGMNHGTGYGDLFSDTRKKLIDQLSQEPFIGLYFLHQLNGFRNFIQAVPKHAREKLAFTFDVLGSDAFSGGKVLGSYRHGRGIHVPLDARLSRQNQTQMGTFAHEFQHLYSDATGDSLSQILRRAVGSRELESKLKNFGDFFRHNILKKMVPVEFDRFMELATLDYLREIAAKYGLPESMIPKEYELALNEVKRLYTKTGKHIWTLFEEHAQKRGWFITNINDDYYVSPNEWLSMKAQYFLTHDNSSWFFDMFKEHEMENEFLSDGDIAFFRERYGEAAYVRYKLMEARTKEDPEEIRKWTVEWDRLDQGKHEFALPSIYEMVAFINSDVVYRNMLAVVSQLSHDESYQQTQVRSSVVTLRRAVSTQRLLARPELGNEESRQVLSDLIATYQDVYRLRDLLLFMDNQEYSSQISTTMELFYRDLPYRIGKNFDQLREFLLANDGRNIIETRIRSIEEAFIHQHQEQLGQVRLAIESWTSLSVAEFALEMVQGSASIRYPTQNELEYRQIFEALEKSNVRTSQLDYRKVMLLLQQHKDAIQEKIEVLKAAFLTRNAIDQDKVFKAIRMLKTLKAVQLALDLLDGAGSNPWSYNYGDGYQQLGGAFQAQGMNVNNFQPKHFGKVLRLTQARPVIYEKMREYSTEFSGLESKAEDAIGALLETKALLPGLVHDLDTSDSTALQKIDVIPLIVSYGRFEEQLREVQQLLAYSSDTDGREYIHNRLRSIIEEGQHDIESLTQFDTQASSPVKEAFERVVSNAQNILDRLESPQRDRAQLGEFHGMTIENRHKSTQQGGVDFTANRTPLEIQNSAGDIKFHLDPAMLARLQEASGFVPMITSVQSIKNLPEFLGVLSP